ncbi:aldehyde dehydrogenase (NADP(+)) [Actinomadura barringtoniae]|uniref:Aldehyde dehydrogenase (NADP(+)) n=1 Tax=Actinomadura barringtoniae TaxID=1427535 RepID=A0A939P6V0_9ACTN|nr:aldehyde dehydrogenase (NADP(+)) [Actinomadura barringtoniae]MBO2446072.1 aldehyde dehydrogenase (NADP(+)) [Actinomadura barringtoniae]
MMSDVERAATLAWEAFDGYRATSTEARAAFLDSIADEIEKAAPELARVVQEETGLPAARIAGETARTTGQLRMFAEVVREGSWRQTCIEPGDPARTPLPRPDIRQRSIPLGPVAVFGAGNFPLAFSVAGGDTASALAAGAPVVVKAHPAHPRTSEIVAEAIRAAVRKHDLPEGTFGMLQGDSHEIGLELVTHPAIRAVGFTGSRSGGLALAEAAAKRPVPIPVYAEMSAVNPVFLLPGALVERADTIATGFVGSMTGSVGQLCTKPGLVFTPEGADGDRFLEAVAHAVNETAAAPMFSKSVAAAYSRGVDTLQATSTVEQKARGRGDAPQGVAGLFVTTGDDFLADKRLHEEVFGPAAIVVRVRDDEQLAEIVEHLEGQLTATVHMAETDKEAAAQLLRRLELVAGRLVVNGWPTGVEVGHAMVHGGPFPASSAPATTSVGSRAIERFLRPVAYQDVPADLLPPELRSDSGKTA